MLNVDHACESCMGTGEVQLIYVDRNGNPVLDERGYCKLDKTVCVACGGDGRIRE